MRRLLILALTAPSLLGLAVVAPTASAACTFPGRAETSGNKVVLACGATLGTPTAPAKGFDVQLGTGSNSYLTSEDYSAMKAEGATFIRFVVHWQDLMPTCGNSTSCVDTSYQNVIDTQIGLAAAAGLYSYLSLYWTNNPPVWITACGTHADTQFEACGKVTTQYFANRYGDSTNPTFQKSVMGMALNEIGDGTANSQMNPNIEVAYEDMLAWMRAPGYAPEWIGWVQSGNYGSWTGLFNDANAGWPCTSSVTCQDKWANTKLSDYINTGNTKGTNGDVIATEHDYALGTIPHGSTPPSGAIACPRTPCDGRTYNGTTDDVTSGGFYVKMDNTTSSPWTTYPISWGSGSQSRSDAQATLKAFIAPLFNLAAGTGANSFPADVEEWGMSQYVTSGVCNYVNDQKAAWNPSTGGGASMESYWDYATTTNVSQDKYAARPGGVFQKAVNEWMQSTCTGV